MNLVSEDARRADFRKVDWMERDLDVHYRPDGIAILKSRVPLPAFETHLPAYLRKWAAEIPDTVWLAERSPSDGEWKTITYHQARHTIDALTEALLVMKQRVPGPLAILSGNSIEHALITLAAMQARITVAPVSPAYSLQTSDFAKLRYVFDLVKPAIVFVQDGVLFGKALGALDLDKTQLIHVNTAPGGLNSVSFGALADTPPTAAVEESIANIDGDTVGKYLFTSGSTGVPKAAINTQRMMCANVAMIAKCRPLDAKPGCATMIDWLPWNHTMGAHGTFNLCLALGHTLYIDDGRPLPGQIDKTIRNLRGVSPHSYLNAPSGYAALITALEHDEALRKTFFKELQLLCYAGAKLPQDLNDRIQTLAIKTTGKRVPFIAYYGATETAPVATISHWNSDRVGLIGLPCPGVELKLVPTDSKFEIRIKGMTVMPGYFNQPDLTAAAFDDEGYYRIGDLVEFVDSSDPRKGLAFAGRLAEEFKLLTGTFVPVTTVRVDAVTAASPILGDALVTGHDREFVGLLAWLNLDACRALIGDSTAVLPSIKSHPTIIEKLRAALQQHNRTVGHSSSRAIQRVILLGDPPSIDDNEITDKGYVNQRVGLARRAALVDRLYQRPVPPDVIVVD